MHEELSLTLQIAILAVQVGVILFAAKIAGKIFSFLRMPAVLGELLTGIVIGPYLLGSTPIAFHGLENGLFPFISQSQCVSTPLYALATFGSIILLFLSGLETDLRQFFRYSLTGTCVGIGGALFSFLFGAWLGMWLFKVPFMDPRVLFLGILSTATSVGITARILSERKCMDSPEGTTIMAAAVIDDVLGIICLAVVLGIAGASGSGGVNWGKIGNIALKSVGIWLGATLLGYVFAHKIATVLKKSGQSAEFSVLALGLALLCAGLFESAGLAMIVGAYVAGLSLSRTDIAFTLQNQLRGLYHFLVPVFFVVTGMMVDVRVFANPQVVKYGLIFSLLAVLAKVIGCALPARLLNFNTLGALRIGIGMIPRGEVALIIAGIGVGTTMLLDGKKVPIINAELFGIAIIMTLLTTVIAPPLLSFVLAIKKQGTKKPLANDGKSLYHTYTFPSETIRDMVLKVMQEHFYSEGFRHSSFDRDGEIISFRRGTMVFSLVINGNSLVFESDSREAVIIKSVMYETFVEIRRTLGELQQHASLFGKNMLEAIPETKMEKVDIPLPKKQSVVPERVLLDLKAEDMEGAIKEMIAFLSGKDGVLDAEKCVADVLKRESIASTSMEQNVAFPHARTKGVDRFLVVIGISRKGLTPTGEGKEPVHVVVLSLASPGFDHPYLEFVAHAAKVLLKKENVQKMTLFTSPEEVCRLFNTEE